MSDPTFADLTTQADALRREVTDLVARENTIKEQLGDLASREEQERLLRERRELRAQRADLSELLPGLEGRIATLREMEGKAAATKRMQGISRAFGSLRQELGADEAKAQEAATAFTDAVQRVNDRYRALATLRREANALADRFGVEAPTLTAVVLPAMREGCQAAAQTARGADFLDSAHVSPRTERCEHQVRTRRTYGEIAGTPAFEIIEAAGLTPWSPLTEREQGLVAAKERERAAAREFGRRVEAETPRSVPRHGI